MSTAITHEIKVQVKTAFQEQQSNPSTSDYMFAYRISIQNQSDYTIQLLRRKWLIVDSNGDHREVEGEGVVGVQPILNPAETHQYVSGCNLKTDIGKMSGTYLFERLVDGVQFTVTIPEFQMVVPYRCN